MHDSTKSSVAPSKIEKDKENAAHKRQVVQQPAITPPLAVSSPLTSPHAPLAVSSPLTSPQAPLGLSSPLTSPYSASQRMIQMSDSPQPLNASLSGPNTPFATPNTTPADTPNTTPNPLQGLSNAVTPNSTPTPLQGIGWCLAPAPPTRSRTPSPVVSFRRSIENALESIGDVETKSSVLYHSMEDVQNKSGELVRRPSIAKLKEMFEKSVDLDAPGTRLSRSASSVTSRSPTLSLHQDNNSNSRVKRKSSLGAEETLQSKKAYEIIEKSRQINICPPPPSSSEQQSYKGLQSSKSSSCVGKPPSSPVWASPSIRRRPAGIHGQSESQEEPNMVLLARVDDRPALPVKKSKSFRSNRPIYSPSNTIASTRSPELSRKKERKDINTYFSLDRGKNEPPPAMSRSESGNIHFIGDIPSPREGFKLSVYQSLPLEGTDVVDSKPQIPPKKSIGDRFKGSRPPEPLHISSSQAFNPSQPTMQQHSDASSSVSVTPSTPPTPQSAPPTINSIYDAPSLWNSSPHTRKDSKDKKVQDTSKSISLSSPTIETKAYASNTTSSPLIAAITTASPKMSPGSDIDSPAGKDYVNARIVRSSNTSDTKESPKYVYVPLPTKRTTRDQKSHEYANYNIGASFPRIEGEETTETYMEAQDLKKNLPGKFPVYDDVSPSSSISRSELLTTSSRESIHTTHSPATSPNTPQTPSTPQNADYEMMDFGESSSNIDEVFETVNYEILGSKEKSKRQDLQGFNSSDDNMNDFLSKPDLDPIARQVYQDCQDYLLHGNNRSPVPSLMPKSQHKDVTKQNNSSRKSGSLLDTSMDVDEVKNKVAVAPQGLRTRERRNSYRQAVNPPSAGNTPTTPPDPSSCSDIRKSVHKYETIWFENGKQQQQQGTKRNNPSPPSQPNSKSSNTHKESDDIPRSSSSSYVQRPSSPCSVDEQSPNLNNKSNNKEAMFKEKLEELHSLVKSLERQKQSKRLCEVGSSVVGGEESSSVSLGSSSTSSALQSPSSTLQSRSTTSSKSELHEPIYANTNTLNATTPPKNQAGTQKYIPSEPKSPQSIRHNKPIEVNEGGKPTRNSPTINGSSIYGTIATSTFRHKNNNSSSPKPNYQSQVSAAGQGKPPSPYHSMPPTSTLPSRPTTSPTPYHNIPPPKGFGGTVSAGNSPNPLQEISNRDNNNKESPSSSPYYKLGMFGSVRGSFRGGQTGQSEQCGSSGSSADSHTAKTVSPYSNIPSNAAVTSRSTGNYPQHTPKAHIVGDIAIVAPPRIKRNSSAAVPSNRGGGHQQPPQQHSHSHWRNGGESDGFSTTTITQSVKQGWRSGQEEGAPPAIPAKTAAAYQFPSDSQCPPHPPTTQHLPYIQPPPPKPVLQSTLSAHHHHHHNQHNHHQRHHHQHHNHHHRKFNSPHSSHISQTSQPPTQPLSTAIYQSPPQPAPAQSPPLSSSSSVDRESQPNNQHQSVNKPPAAADAGPKNSSDVPRSARNESSDESSDEEGIFHKFSAPNLFKKWISAPNTNSKLSKNGNGAPSSPKSVFYQAAQQSEKEMRDEAIETRGNAGSTSSVGSKENPRDTCTPTSPKPLIKALGKLKTSSKSVAANFKSYLTPRGDKMENIENVRGTAAGSSISNHSGGLQKSMSSGNSILPYSQVQQDYSYPSSLPKKSCGPGQDMTVYTSSHSTGGVLGSADTQLKQQRPRQQYL
ncbi:unnamed protein product [Meganyctiphanes norvegica]|uniref:Uncharacterized protein n=1 Tax=Meganyctiphanes norvegica TaxID=48144 RepID=A0AAV2S1N2_MEGNR